jgi:MscS family membrane protein
MIYYIKRILSLTILLFVCLLVNAQNQGVQPSLASPYHTIYTHLYYLQPENYDEGIASTTIDPRVVTDSLKRVELAIQLKQILDSKGLFVYLNKIPKKSNYRDTITGNALFTLFPIEMPQVYVERNDGRWYFSEETVRAIPKLHKETFPFGTNTLMKVFPKFNNVSVMGLALWQYFALLILLLVCVIFYILVQRIFRPIVTRLLRRWRSLEIDNQKKSINAIASVLALMLITQVVKYILPSFLLPVRFSQATMIGLSIFQTVFFTILLLRLIDFFVFYLERGIVQRTESKMDDQLVPIIHRVLKIMVVLGAVIHVLSLLNVNVTALIAGVSIGGLAIALAAQDAVKNLIGSLMIFIDKPFQIGDFVIGDGFEGEIVEVGFRTTRIKSVDTSIISVPNGVLANMSVRNLGVRVMRLMDIKIGVTYDTPPDVLEKYIAGLKEIILRHPTLYNESYYVHLREMADSALMIMFRAYLNVPGFPDELKVKEEVYFLIMRLADHLGISFAFPSTSVYVEQFKKSTDEHISTVELEDFFQKWLKESNESA